MASARTFSWTALALVVVGGAVGVALRAAVTVPLTAGSHPLVIPAVTLGINVIGALLLGVLVGAMGDRHPRWRSFLGTGMLGGFTTYSAFAVHVVTTGTAAPLVALALIALTLFGGLAAAALGLALGRKRSGIDVPVAPEVAE